MNLLRDGQSYLLSLLPTEPITSEYVIRQLLGHPKSMLMCILFGTFRLYVARKWSYWSKRGISGPAPSILKFGNITEFFQLAGNEGDELTKKHGNMFGFYMGGRPQLYLSDIEIMKEVLVKQFSKFNRREAPSGGTTMLGEVTKDFMTTIDGAQWRRVRHSTVPLMSASKLSDLIPLINKAARVCCEQLSTECDYETKEMSQAYTIRAIMSATFAIDPDDKDAMDEAAHHANNVVPDNLSQLKMMMYALTPERIRFKYNLSPIPKATRDYFDTVVKQLLEMHQQGKSVPCFATKMMSSLIPSESTHDASITKGFTVREVHSNAVLVILAGFETTASTLQFILFSLCKHPKIQHELYEASKSIDVTKYESLKEFKLLDAIIKETMRLYPAAVINSRYCSETTEIKEGLTIEAGTTVVWSILKYHMDPDLYDEPERFNPSRWTGNESNTLQDDAWFSFGQGPRACPGTRLAYYFMKIYIVQLITQYHIVETRDTPATTKVVLKNFKVSGEKPLMVKLEKR